MASNRRKHIVKTTNMKIVKKEVERRRKAVAAVVLIISREMQTRNRIFWKRPWLNNHDSQGAMSNLVRELKCEDTRSFQNYCRMSPGQFEFLLSKVEALITKQDTNFHKAIPAKERLTVTLRFLATGETYKSLSYSFRLGATAIGQIVPETCRAIFEVMKDDYMKMPQTKDEWRKIAEEFYNKWDFPNTLGALDGKHIAVLAPKNSGSVFYNYKKFFSIVLMALVDANYKFIYVDVGCNGRISDGGVFAGGSLSKALNEMMLGVPKKATLPGSNTDSSYHIVADDAFPLKEHIMKPYPFRNLTRSQRIFNYRLSRARRVVENAFGILSQKFRLFLGRINLQPDRAEIITLAACVLHNFLRDVGDPIYTHRACGLRRS